MKRFFIAFLVWMSISATHAAELRTIADALKLSASDGLGPWPFELTGQIYSGTGPIRDFKDKTAGYPFEDHRTNRTPVAMGDIVRIRGELTIDPDDLHHFQVRHLNILRNDPLPTPVLLSDAALNDPQSVYTFAKIRGVVTAVELDDIDANYQQLVLKTKSHSVDVSVSSALIPNKQLRRLLDAEVEVGGLFTRKAGWRRNIGMHLQMYAANDLKILSPPPEDPFNVPELSNGDILHRQKASGRVIASGSNRFFLSTRTGRFLEVHSSKETSVPAPNTCVETCGFAELSPFLLCLTEALVRPVKAHIPPVPPPQKVNFDQLFSYSNGVSRVDTAKHGRLICLTGSVSDLLDRTTPHTFFIQHRNLSVTVDMSGLHPSPAIPPPNSKVEITGLCLIEFENGLSHRPISKFRRYVLFPRSDDDVRILSTPSWWTPLKLVLIISILVVTLVTVLIWNRSLRILSERRGRQLYREEFGHILAEKKTEERTRLAVELHDSISQTLTGVAMQVDAARQSDLSNPGTAIPYLDMARLMLASCRHELRCCIWDLRSRTFEERNLQDAILNTLRPHIGKIDLAVRFNVSCRLLSESTIHTILRIIRELSVNALRHGRATRLRIAGERQANMIRFSVRDNGCGFNGNTTPPTEAGHFGLQGIRERLKTYNGQLVFQSSPEHGTKATVTLVAPELEESA